MNPESGESTIAAVVLARPPQTMASRPILAVPAPTSPPTSACELDEGMPPAQVMRFQMIAPISAPNTTRGSITSAATMPVPMVWATCEPKIRNAMKLKKAAMATACCGRITRVETTVAIELAASCRPLRKSNASATTMSPIKIGRASATASMSHVFEHDAVNLVGHVVETIDNLLEMIVDLAADEERHRVGRLIGAIEIAQADIVQVVGLTLDERDLLRQPADATGVAVDGAQQRDRLLHQQRRFDDRLGHLLLLRRERALVEQQDGFGGLLHLVDGVVHRGDQVFDIATIERRDESAAYRDQHLAGDVVGIVLAIHHDLVVLLDRRAAFEHLPQRLGTGHDDLGMAREQVKEPIFFRQ